MLLDLNMTLKIWAQERSQVFQAGIQEEAKRDDRREWRRMFGGIRVSATKSAHDV